MLLQKLGDHFVFLLQLGFELLDLHRLRALLATLIGGVDLPLESDRPILEKLSLPIVEQAIQLRQMRKMSPGDALIAATALYFSVDIYTRNVTDFNWITGLTVVNPI